MPEHLLGGIFDPYFTTRQQGSGLGLAICHSIIQKHNGEVRVESTPGQGTTFYVSLPVAEQVVASDPAPHQKVTRGNGSILVMDDEKAVRKVAKASLKVLGYYAECTENGSAAVELYRRRMEEGTPFAAVIMDLTIPGGIGGKEAITLLNRIDPEVKAVVSSGYSIDPVLANYREYGFCATLSKPYTLQELRQVLLEFLDGDN